MEDYKYVVEAYDKYDDCPEFSNAVKTFSQAICVSLIIKSFNEGLNTIIRNLEDAEGMNIYYEED